MLLTVSVKVSQATFKKLIDQAMECRYPVREVQEKGGSSFWIEKVCFGERRSHECWIYPLSFARYKDDEAISIDS